MCAHRADARLGKSRERHLDGCSCCAPELRKVADPNGDLKTRLANIPRNAKEELKEVEAARALQKEALAEIQKDLDALLKVAKYSKS